MNHSETFDNILQSTQKHYKNVPEKIKTIRNQKELADLHSSLLGSQGSVRTLFRLISQLSPDEKRLAGKTLANLKIHVTQCLEDAKHRLTESTYNEKPHNFDATFPGHFPLPKGSRHPISLMLEHSVKIFSNLNFQWIDSNEIELEHYNFDALNIPPEHPSRQDQDSFYLGNNKLLRTQTTAVQIRILEKQKPPFAIVAAGRCFRKDAIDATHFPIFHQLEGLVVDKHKHIGLSKLKGMLEIFAKQMFGKNIETRFSPDYFPFTVPSMEFGIRTTSLGSQENKTKASDTRPFLEIAGCGLVQSSILKRANLDPEEWGGYAFGIGIERLAMLKWSIPDIRLFYKNDPDFLKQFAISF